MFVHLNECYKFKLCRDLYLIQFDNFYSHIIVKLYDAGILNDSRIETIKSNLMSGITHSAFYNVYFIDREWYRHINHFQSGFYDDLLNSFSSEIAYIDTCYLIVNDVKVVEFLKRFDIPYNVSNISFFWLERKKNLIYMLSSGELMISGHGLKNRDFILDRIKSESRNDKLNSIL